MGIISDSINKRRNLRSDDGAVTRAERAEHHNYQEELTAFGFVSPLVLPSDRLQELKGDMTLDEFANACHIKTREAEILIENPEMEPTTQHLLTTSYVFGVSVLWLLGYHTSKENGTRHFDRELLSLISRRNAAEDQAYRIKQKDRFRNLFITNISKRVYQLNLQISQTAARAVATEHYPLSSGELYGLKGTPVYVEYDNGEGEWGLCRGESIVTESKELPVEENDYTFRAYMLPNTRPVLGT